MAILFDGVDDYLAVGTGDIITIGSPISIFVRLKVIAFTGGAYDRILHRRNTTSAAAGFSFEIGPGGDIGLAVDGAGALEAFSDAGAIALDTEYSIVLTWDGGTAAANINVYVNGTEAIQGFYEANGSVLVSLASQPTSIGRKSDDTTYANFLYRELAIFDRVVSAGEIATLSSNPQLDAIKAMSGLVRYFPMNDGADGTSADGDAIVDFSPNATNATGVDGANNTGLTWSGTRKTVSAQIITSNLPTIGAKKVTKLPSAQTITTSLPTIVKKVNKTANAQVISSNLPTPTVSAGGSTTVAVNALVITSALGTATPKVTKIDAGQTIQSNLPSVVKSVTKSASAQTIQSNLPTVGKEVRKLPDALTIQTNQPAVTLSGVVNKTVIVDALVITSNLPTVSKGVTKLPEGMTISSAMGGVTPKVATDVSAFQLLASLPGVTIAGGSTNATFISDAFVIRSILATPNIAIFPQVFKRYAKHSQPKNISKNSQPRNISKHQPDFEVTKGGIN